MCIRQPQSPNILPPTIFLVKEMPNWDPFFWVISFIYLIVHTGEESTFPGQEIQEMWV